MDKAGRYNVAPTSDTDSGRRTVDTPLQTFSEGIECTSVRENSNSAHSFSSHREHSQVYASLSEDPYATVGESSEFRGNLYEAPNAHVQQNGRMTRTSSFKPKPSNPYASYDSLDYDIPADVRNDYHPHQQQNVAHAQNTTPIHTNDPYISPYHQVHPSPHPQTHTNSYSSSAHVHGNHHYSPEHFQHAEDFPPPPVELQRSYSEDVPHYVINDDEYAIVQKPKRKPTDYQNSQGSNGYSPTRASGDHRDASFSPVTGVLPHHECMLSGEGHSHNLPPFVPHR